MFKLIGKLFGGLIRTVLLGAILLGGLALGVYGWHVHSELKGAISAAGIAGQFSVSYQPVTRKKALVETSWPLTVRAYVKRTDAHNWVPVEGRGLVAAVFQWTPDQDRWVQESRPEVGTAQRLKLEAMIKNPLYGQLIEALRDPDVIVRDVAIRELRIRTNQDLGFRSDGSDKEREEAVARWDKWWEENKTKRTAGGILDKVREILK